MSKQKTWPPPPEITILQHRIESLEVRFDVPDYAWIPLHVPALLGEPYVACTETDDPFPMLIDWLEAIATRRPSATWQVSEEGGATHFAFLGATGFVGDDASQLIVTRTHGVILHVSACVIGRRAVVGAFYSAFRAMTESTDYAPFHWESAPGPVDWDSLTEEEDDALRLKNPFDGNYLRDMRSATVEAFLASDMIEREDESDCDTAGAGVNPAPSDDA